MSIVTNSATWIEIYMKNSDTRLVCEDVYVYGQHATIRSAPARARHTSTHLASSHLAMPSPTRDGARRPPARYVTVHFLPRGFRALDAADDDRATRGGAMCTRNAVWHNARGRDATARARATRIGFD